MWPEDVHRELAAAGVRIVGYVPDAGHKRLIELCQADKAMRAVVLTTEEEGVGLAAGAWLGGEKSVLLIQSSGVGNLINVLGTVQVCRFPLVMIVTMRGEEGEFNPWQVPMGRGTPQVLEAMGVSVQRAADGKQVAPHSSLTMFGWPTSNYRARAGVGQTHHVAFRADDVEQLGAWHDHLSSMQLDVTPVLRRQYYSSVYFTAPDGLLMEIATDS